MGLFITPTHHYVCIYSAALEERQAECKREWLLKHLTFFFFFEKPLRLLCILFSTESITFSCLLPEPRAFLRMFLPHQTDRAVGCPSTCLPVCLSVRPRVLLPTSPASSYTELHLNPGPAKFQLPFSQL